MQWWPCDHCQHLSTLTLTGFFLFYGAGQTQSKPNSWLNLGDCFLHTFQVRRAIWAFEQAVVVQRLTNDASKLFKARSWICDWTDRELMADMIRADIAQSLQRGQPPAARAADFTDTDACTLLQMSRLMGLPYEAKRHLQLRPRLQLPSTAVLRIGERGGGEGSEAVAEWAVTHHRHCPSHAPTQASFLPTLESTQWSLSYEA